ncbi:hypothetical protein BH10ACT4_BH10ACT4_12210 [soil metagenome]
MTPAQLAEANIARIFNEPDAADRRSAIDELYTADAEFADPEGTATGHDAFADSVTALLARSPEWRFHVEVPAAGVGDLAVIHWGFGPVDGDAVVHGQDVVIARDGQIAKLYTLLG